ncbi:MAG: HU family DNA-binding protein [Methylacidiphilales bacterium]|nr:HU family DNA-binding protein [Candidatus Methylacidiphilales bacterium]
MQTITKYKIASDLSKEFGMSVSETSKLVDSFFISIKNILIIDGAVKINKFFKCTIRVKSPRIGIDFKNRKKIIINSRKVVAVKFSKLFKL